ncbi:MAG: hypothetical protein RR219_00060 [Clostridiales bacterium]
MKPLSYAILKYMTTVEKACVADVIEALKPEYGSFRMLTPKGVLEYLMTGEQNALLEEAGYELDKNGELVIYYHAPEDGAATINTYIK